MLSWSVGGGIWGGAAIVGGVTRRTRAGPEPAWEIRAGSGPLPSCSFQAWLRAVGAGGPGRHGLGPGCLLPRAPRVGAGHL